MRARPDKLLPASAGPPRRPTWRQIALLTAGGGGALAALALLSPTAGALLLALLCLGVTLGVLGLVSLRGSFADDWADLVVHSFWAAPASVAGVFTARALLDLPLARFDAARREVQRLALGRGARTLADVAHATGYADHSHLVRDFRRFAGASPTQWVREELGNIQAGGHTDGPGWEHEHR